MICILHGYLLDGSGSNLWTQSMVRALCRMGETVHLVCQEPHPERFDFVARAIRYDEASRPGEVLSRPVDYPGRCIVHKPGLGKLLPVYVWDEYEDFERVVPMVDLDDEAIEAYVRRNVQVLERVVASCEISAIHANHVVLMPEVARRVAPTRSIPYTVMPHGSAIEYAVRKDPRFHRLASEGLAGADGIFVIGEEIRQRMRTVFSSVADLEERMTELRLGVDTGLFSPIQPARRRASIEGLGDALEGEPRGKGPELSARMGERLCDSMGLGTLRAAMKQASGYPPTLADADCAEKLEAIDWEADSLLIFIGRLIASKGSQLVISALPSILRDHPSARLLVVGHGPLREAMEAMVRALESGSRGLLDGIVCWGKALEGSPVHQPFEHVRLYLEQLERSGELEEYLETARRMRLGERVVFTGYLTHDRLCQLLPCCDVAVFPSIVAEAGPLVFLEAMASGVLPMGSYFAGMAASIDSVAPKLPHGVAELMKLRPEPRHTVQDIVSGVSGALLAGRSCAGDLRAAAVERYDWSVVASSFLGTLRELAREANP